MRANLTPEFIEHRSDILEAIGEDNLRSLTMIEVREEGLIPHGRWFKRQVGETMEERNKRIEESKDLIDEMEEEGYVIRKNDGKLTVMQIMDATPEQLLKEGGSPAKAQELFCRASRTILSKMVESNFSETKCALLRQMINRMELAMQSDAAASESTRNDNVGPTQSGQSSATQIFTGRESKTCNMM